LIRLILLDSGPLGMVANPKARSPTVRLCKEWLKGLLDADVRVIVPEVAEYEVRRELLRGGMMASAARLDELAETLGVLAVTGATWRRAAELWAEARIAGFPTAGDAALDADVILAAQAQIANEAGFDAIVATENIGHLGRFADARLWPTIQA
jgi:hypothetical protein